MWEASDQGFYPWCCSDCKGNINNRIMQEIVHKKERVIAYIDGFNLYFGMREAGFDHCRWLNVKKISRKFAKI